MPTPFVWYEGGTSGYALILPPGSKKSHEPVSLIVFADGNGASSQVDGVPQRAEGGGHTWRLEK